MFDFFSNVHMCWTIFVHENDTVEMSSKFFDLEQSHACKKDRISIYCGMGENSYSCLKHFVARQYRLPVSSDLRILQRFGSVV